MTDGGEVVSFGPHEERCASWKDGACDCSAAVLPRFPRAELGPLGDEKGPPGPGVFPVR